MKIVWQAFFHTLDVWNCMISIFGEGGQPGLMSGTRLQYPAIFNAKFHFTVLLSLTLTKYCTKDGTPIVVLNVL